MKRDWLESFDLWLDEVPDLISRIWERFLEVTAVLFYILMFLAIIIGIINIIRALYWIVTR